MFDALIDLLRFLFYLLAFMFFLMALPFVFCHVADTWDAPASPHNGFSPECPTWEEPKNTLPPTSELATRRAPRGEF